MATVAVWRGTRSSSAPWPNWAITRRDPFFSHADAYADAMDDEFNQRFPWFVDHWGNNPVFDCVIAYDGDEGVAFAYGAPATPYREWWREHLEPTPERNRTFSYSELAVRTNYRKTGVSELVTRALLDERNEDLAVLLVDTEHPRVQAIYESWSFRKVGDQPEAAVTRQGRR